MATAYKRFSDGNFTKKIVAVRADLDVPMSKGEILDDTKIRNLIPTLLELIKAQSKVVILASLGDQIGEYKDENSLMQVRFAIGNLLAKPVKFVDVANCDNSIKFMDFGEVLVLENLNFHSEEFKGKPEAKEQFMEKITTYCNYFINEGFGLDHSLASIGVLESKLESFYGLSYQKDLDCVEKMKEGFKEPSVLILGGEARLDKVSQFKKVVTKFNQILVGGEISLYFLAAKGVKVGKTKLDEKVLKKVEELIKLIESKKIHMVLPVDHIVSESLEGPQGADIDVQVVPNNKYVVDIGEKTLVLFREIIEAAKTIAWYGPVGRYEVEEFNRGTESVGEYIALSAGKDCVKVALGTSTLVAINKLKVKKKRFSCLIPNEEAYLDLA